MSNFINSYFYVICNSNILFKGSIEHCISYLHKLDVKNNFYYFVVNCLEYDHPNNIGKRFNSYFTRFNNDYYDFIDDAKKNHLSLLKYMDDLQLCPKYKQLSIFDF